MLHRANEVSFTVLRVMKAVNATTDPTYMQMATPIKVELQPFSSLEAMKAGQLFSNVVSYFTCPIALDVRKDDVLYDGVEFYQVTTIENYRNILPHREVYVSYSQAKPGNFFSVTYDGNGADSGAVPVEANKYQRGSVIAVLPNSGVLARTGYTFSGWNTAADGSGSSYAPGSMLSIKSANVTLYARWL